MFLAVKGTHRGESRPDPGHPHALMRHSSERGWSASPEARLCTCDEMITKSSLTLTPWAEAPEPTGLLTLREGCEPGGAAASRSPRPPIRLHGSRGTAGPAIAWRHWRAPRPGRRCRRSSVRSDFDPWGWFALARWLYVRCRLGNELPIVLLDHATARSAWSPTAGCTKDTRD